MGFGQAFRPSPADDSTKELRQQMIKIRLPLILTLLLSLGSVLAVSANDDPHDSLVINAKGEVRRWEITGPWGGDVRALVVSPTNPDLLYLGTSDGQIFLSKDGARTWQRIKPGIDKRGLSVDQIVIEPARPEDIVCGGLGGRSRDRG